MQFKIQSPYRPTGDQPEAIKEICEAVNAGADAVTLLGVTGSGKTPDTQSQQDPCCPALRGVQVLLSGQRSGVFRLLLRLLPARGLPPGDRHLH